MKPVLNSSNNDKLHMNKQENSSNPMLYFKMGLGKYAEYGGVEHAEYCFQHYSSAETCLSAFQAPLDPSTALRGFVGSNFSEASAFVITYPVNNKLDIRGNENGKAMAWEKAFIRLLKVLLGLSGVAVVILCVVGSIGFFSRIGVKSTLIVMEVIPFLVLAPLCTRLQPGLEQKIVLPRDSYLQDYFE